MTQPAVERVREALARVIHGKREVIDLLLVAALSGGHVLVEDVPGVGKTTLAKAFARVFRIGCTRVQFTPDLLPADIIGSQILSPKDGTLRFTRGPVFTNVLLADEINRASPRTQSALLEAMSERQVTVDGESHPLAEPFFVIATQNPVDYAGTYPLPEAQLDRFLLRVRVGYPGEDDELRMLVERKERDPLDDVVAVADEGDLVAWMRAVREIEVKEPVARYLLRLVEKTRDHRDLALGVSPRGSLALFRAAQARAFLAERTWVSPDDVQALAVPVLAHRVQLSSQARYGGSSAEALVASIVHASPVPT